MRQSHSVLVQVRHSYEVSYAYDAVNNLPQILAP